MKMTHTSVAYSYAHMSRANSYEAFSLFFFHKLDTDDSFSYDCFFIVPGIKARQI